MRKGTLAFTLVLVAVVAAATASVTRIPPADGGQLWKYITTFNPYTKWKMWPGHEGMYAGKSPHGAYLKVYLNPIAYAAVDQKRAMPNGAIIVKENYGKDKKTLMAVTPMYRVKGFNPDAGDWFRGKYGPKGKVMAAGKVKGCIKCHSVQKSKDWIFTGAQ